MTISTGARIRAAVLGDKLRWPVEHPPGACRVCGCTEEWGCPEGCSWVIDPAEELGETGYGLCDACLDRVQTLLETPENLWADTLAVDVCLYADANALALAIYLARARWRKALIRNALRRRFLNRQSPIGNRKSP